MNSEEIRSLSLAEVAAAIKGNQLSSVEVTEACVEHAAATEDALHTFVHFTPDSALERAAAADAALQRGELWGPLHGVPVAFKDNLDTAGIPTECASPVLKGRVPTEDAHSVALVMGAGAVSLGKLNMHEFASGGTSINGYTGSPRNPWNPDYITGGSSGGSSTAIVAGIVYATLGTDAGGSVRIPASICGHVGLKQTHGLVSNRGNVFNTWSGDHVGPHTKTVEDAALMLRVLAQHDPLDATSVPATLGPLPEFADLSGMRIGVPENFFFEGADPEVAGACHAAISLMKAAGATLVPFRVELVELMTAARMLTGADAYCYHARLLEEKGELYHDQNLRYRLLASRYLRAEDYARSLRARTLVIREFVSLFERMDAFVAPTVQTTAFPIAAKELTVAGQKYDLATPNGSFVLAHNTFPMNWTGLPSVSIPAGRASNGMPIGVMLTGPHFADMKLLGIAKAAERLIAYRDVAPWFETRTAVAA